MMRISYDPDRAWLMGVRVSPIMDMSIRGFYVVQMARNSKSDPWLFTVRDNNIELPPYMQVIERWYGCLLR